MDIIIDGTTVSPKATSIELAHCVKTVNIYWENMIGNIRAEGGKKSISYETAMVKYSAQTMAIMQNLTHIFECEMTEYYAPKPDIEEEPVEEVVDA